MKGTTRERGTEAEATRRRLSAAFDETRKACAPVQTSFWSYNRAPARDEPRQGFKIHVSATVLSASDVLARCHRALSSGDATGHATGDVAFKVCSNLDALVYLNTGLHYPQVGKFLTVYCRDDREFVALARRLKRATRGLDGPVVPFDRRVGRSGIVYYRYGAFDAPSRQPGAEGRIVDAAGRSRRDTRSPGQAVPSWIDDPLAGVDGTGQLQPARPVGDLYIPFRAISQRGKGGVYEALDLSGARARSCILKEGRLHGEVFWDGSDGRTYLARETSVLRALARSGVGVPRILGRFAEGANDYLVLERIPGQPLGRTAGGRFRRLSWLAILDVHARLAELLKAIHAAGWVWRDCKPDNLLVADGALRPIDFEGACPVDATDVVPWSAPGFVPPRVFDRMQRQAGTAEDSYGLAASLFRLGTSRLPPRSRARQEAMLTGLGCPKPLRRVILGGLAPQ